MARHLIRGISVKVSGVFLWVHVVVRNVLAGLRDGEGMESLQRKLRSIPGDLKGLMKLI